MATPYERADDEFRAFIDSISTAEEFNGASLSDRASVRQSFEQTRHSDSTELERKFEQRLKEQREEQEQRLKEQRKEQREELADRLGRLEFTQKILADPIHKMVDFSSGGKSSNRTARQGVKVGDPCPVCQGAREAGDERTVDGFAHIMVDKVIADPELKNRLNNAYTSDYDPTSHRNFIPMCGRHGRKPVDSCHNLFDDHKLVFLPTMDRKVFELFSVHSDADQLNNHSIQLANQPYRRGLAARAKMAFKRYLHDTERVTTDFGARIDFSDSSSNRERGDEKGDDSD